jgi:hypothetical protein
MEMGKVPLQARRFLLPADVQRYIDEAAASDVLR